MVGARPALAALPVLAAALVLAACGGADGSTSVTRATPVRIGALVLDVPAGFSRLTRRVGRVAGVVVTDYPIARGSPTLTTGVFPANRVALVLARSPRLRIAAPPLRLPLRLAELRGPQHRADGASWNGLLRLDGSLYAISVWAGRTAPSRDRAALLHALASIRRAP